VNGDDEIAAKPLHRRFENERVERESVAIDIGFVALAPVGIALLVRQRAPGCVDGCGRRTALYTPIR
jgi:hypothetical protein